MSNETVIKEKEICELHKYGEPDNMGFIFCSKCGDASNIHDEIDQDYDEYEEILDIECPKCHREYDSISYEYQVCRFCNYVNE